MERTKQKSKKDKPNKYVEKEKSSSFISDVKAFKENLKIREILKTVKMNSSMRIKAPRGSKVMQNKDFTDNEDIFEDAVVCSYENDEPPCATNTILNTTVTVDLEDNSEPVVSVSENTENASVLLKSKSLSEGLDDTSVIDTKVPVEPSTNEGKLRDRKLSLDHTMLLRREGLSQSEVDLHSIGKSPLERKSSFFRKKMDSFVRNTTEIFKRQSMSSKAARSPITSRRDSTCSRMSVSLQSLNENSTYFEEFKDAPLDKYRDQQSSISSLATPRTDSTVSINVNDRLEEDTETTPASEIEELPGSRSLNNELNQDLLLNTRAISMSSGLDTATGQRRRKTSRSNRVSWLASEGLTDYFRRLIQDEKSQEIQGWHSYQDFSAIPESKAECKPDSKGRRLSYMRAVSGEDPSLASSFRKKRILENELYFGCNMPTGSLPRLRHRDREREQQQQEVAVSDVERTLAHFAANGIPPLEGYTPHQLGLEAAELLEKLDSEAAIDSHFNFPVDVQNETAVQQQVLKEFVYSESQYIKFLRILVNVYITAAHALQNSGYLLELNTSTLFSHIPDILNSSYKFWERAIYPMLRESMNTGKCLNVQLLVDGFVEFTHIFEFYEDFVQYQSTAIEYLRNMLYEPEFATYSRWCSQRTHSRLQLADILVKPMQRLTKYSLLIRRLAENTQEATVKNELFETEVIVKAFNLGVNRAVRQRDEIRTLEELRIDPYEPDYKGDDDMEASFRSLGRFHIMQPMMDCGLSGLRNLIHQGPLRYKDCLKEFDAQGLLFTDMLLICKKQPKIKDKDKDSRHKELICWKMVRPKILTNRLVPCVRTRSESNSLVYVVLDELGCSKAVFSIAEPKDTRETREPKEKDILKVWESRILEAMITHTLNRWYFTHNIVPQNLSDIEKMCCVEDPKSEWYAIEKRARERVAAMHHQRKHDHDPYSDRETESTEVELQIAKGPGNLIEIFDHGIAHYNSWQQRKISKTVAMLSMHSSGGSSHHRSSSELHISSSSHEELRSYAGALQRSGSSADYYGLNFGEEGGHRSPSITVNIVPEHDTETLVPSVRSVIAPTLVLQQSSPNHSPGPRSASAGGSSENTLRVSPLQMVYSMPDINNETKRSYTPEPQRPMQETASDRLYRSHQELMYRNRLAAGQHYLKPDHRGSSYPPPNPRALQRGDAVSFSFRYPPLTRTKNVPERTSHSTSHIDATRRAYGRRSPADGTKSPRRVRTPSPVPAPLRPGGQKKSLFVKRSKGSSRSASPDPDSELALLEEGQFSRSSSIKVIVENEVIVPSTSQAKPAKKEDHKE